MVPPPPSSTIFPYTTLFRSNFQWRKLYMHCAALSRGVSFVSLPRENVLVVPFRNVLLTSSRSAQHTSELQSPVHLVCRHLLEEKNNHAMSIPSHHARLRCLL